mmetsp:Transcript_50084/g.134036  ORF Transcript_50084/g.134036 Transcript_50084/m.134036 type:complete len:258 (-) Transcript_50084:108-881(-)
MSALGRCGSHWSKPVLEVRTVKAVGLRARAPPPPCWKASSRSPTRGAERHAARACWSLPKASRRAAAKSAAFTTPGARATPSTTSGAAATAGRGCCSRGCCATAAAPCRCRLSSRSSCGTSSALATPARAASAGAGRPDTRPAGSSSGRAACSGRGTKAWVRGSPGARARTGACASRCTSAGAIAPSSATCCSCAAPTLHLAMGVGWSLMKSTARLRCLLVSAGRPGTGRCGAGCPGAPGAPPCLPPRSRPQRPASE